MASASRLAQLVVGTNRERAHEVLDIELVSTAGAFAFLLDEPDFFFGDVGEFGERRGKCVSRGRNGKHGGGRRIVGMLRHCSTREST